MLEEICSRKQEGLVLCTASNRLENGMIINANNLSIKKSIRLNSSTQEFGWGKEVSLKNLFGCYNNDMAIAVNVAGCRFSQRINLSCFVLDSKGSLLPGGFLFYGRKSLYDDILMYSDTKDTKLCVFRTSIMLRDVSRVVGILSIYDGLENGLTFSMVDSLELLVLNPKTGKTVNSIRVPKDNSNSTMIELFHIKRSKEDWNFRLSGIKARMNLADLCRHYGINVK